MLNILITGASRGLGLEFTRQFADRGERVFAGARHPEKASKLKDLQVAHPKTVTTLTLDVGEVASIRQAYEQIKKETDHLDLLINNAGIYSTQKGAADDPGAAQTIGHLTQDEALTFFKVNSVGPVLIAQEFLDLLERSKNPKIVSITSGYGSIASNEGFPYHYAASKAALNMYSRSLAADLKEQGITVVVMSPGWVSTEMGGAGAPVTPPQSVSGMIKVIDALKPTQTSRFLTWQGGENPW